MARLSNLVLAVACGFFSVGPGFADSAGAQGTMLLSELGDVSIPGVPGAVIAMTFHGDHVYVADSVQQAIHAYERDSSSGALTLVESEPYAPGASGLLVSADGANLYVVSWLGHTLTVYDRDGSTGEIESSESHGVTHSSRILESADGTHVYAVSRTMYVFERDLGTGSLAPVQTLPWVDNVFFAEAVLSPDGAFLYALNTGDGELGVFAVDDATGELSISRIYGNVGGSFIDVSPDGAHLYVTRPSNPADLLVYSRDLVTGDLALVETEEMVDGGRATGLAVSPDGAHAYLSDDESQIFVLARNAGTGEVSPAAVVTDRVDGGRVVSSPEGGHLYTHSGDAVRIFSRDAGTGTLAFSGGLFSLHAATGGAVSPDGAHVYFIAPGVRGREDRLGVFARDPVGGAVTHLETHFDGVDGVEMSDVRDVVISPDGTSIYVRASGLSVFSRSGTGALTFVEHEDGVSAASPVVAADGAHLYTVGNGAIERFDRDAGTGALSHGGSTPTGAGARRLAGSPDGAHLYELSGDVRAWERDAVTGELSLVGAVATESADPRAIAVSPDGGHVYAAVDDFDFLPNELRGRVFAFARDAATGALTPVDAEENGSNGVFGLARIDGLAVTADGTYVVVAGLDEGASVFTDSDDFGSVTVFRRDADTGVLAHAQTIVEGPYRESLRGLVPSPDGSHLYRSGVAGTAALVYGMGFGCAEAPLPDCRTAEKGKLSIDTSLLPAKERVTYSWLGGEATAEEFDPGTSNHFAVCAYDQSGPTPVHVFTALAPAGEDCRKKLESSPKPCWSASSGSAKLKDPFRTPDGLLGLTLKAGAAGRAKILAKAIGEHVRPPELPLGLPLLVQVQAASGLCWETSFESASRNGPARFKAKTQ